MKTGSSEEWTRTTDTRIMIPLANIVFASESYKAALQQAFPNQCVTIGLQKAETPSRVPDPPSDYFAEHYGQCSLDPCECLPTSRHPERRWKGTACPNWKPMGWTSFDQAIAETFT